MALLLIVQGAWAQAVWWNSSYPYRVAVNVSTNSYDRTDWIVERSLNFSALIYNATGSVKDFDNNSVRVIEYTSGGSIINSNNNLGLVSQFDPSPGYNSTSNAIGDVVWMLNGTTPASSTRFFYLYFSDTSRPKGYPNYQTNLSYSWDGRELGVNTSTGAYLADMKAYYGSLQTEKLRMFRVASGSPYDVRIKLLQSEVARGQMLPVEFIAENKGEVGQDIIMDYWISDGSGGTWYSVTGEPGYTPVLQNTTFPKSIPIFSNQPLGLSYITLVVKYDNTQPTIRVNTTFMVVEANVSANVTPPAPPPGPGGGAPPVPVVVSNVTNITVAPALFPRLEFTNLKQEVNVERGSERYATFTLKNTGEKILHNLTLDFSGIPFDWYSVEPAKVNALKVGESTSFMVKFRPLPNAEPREYQGKVRADSDEVSASQEFKIRLFSSKEELIQYEINQLYEKLDGLRKKADDAMAVGKNVSEAYSLLDESENQLGYAERYLDKRMHSNSLIVINTIDNLLERAGYIIDTAKFTPVAPQQKISIITEFPDWLLYLLLLIILLIVLALLYWMRQTKDMERLLVTRGTGEIKSAVLDSENLQALEAEKDRIKQFLRTLDREFETGLISHESYEELRKKNRDRLLTLSLKVYNMKEAMRSKA